VKTEICTADQALIARFPAADMGGKTARVLAAVRGEEVLGIAGVCRTESGYLVFASLTDELRRDRRALVRGMRAVMALAKRCRGPLLATCDEKIPKAAEFLRHIGFVPDATGLWHYEGGKCRR
jgi:hypothetical protein